MEDMQGVLLRIMEMKLVSSGPMPSGPIITEDKLFMTMSITKAAIGLCYLDWLTEQGDFEKAKEWLSKETLFESGPTILNALNHQTGIWNDHSDTPNDPNNFDFETYVTNASDSEYKKLSVDIQNHISGAVGVTPEFAYNNEIWHLLSAKFENLTHTNISNYLRDLLGQDVEFKWEIDVGVGTPLGPQGLLMTESCAMRLGEKWSEIDQNRKEWTETKDGFWDFLGIGPLQCCFGWWRPKNHNQLEFAHGYNKQFIAILSPNIHGHHEACRSPQGCDAEDSLKIHVQLWDWLVEGREVDPTKDQNGFLHNLIKTP